MDSLLRFTKSQGSARNEDPHQQKQLSIVQQQGEV
jgi:hypothetical protein